MTDQQLMEQFQMIMQAVEAVDAKVDAVDAKVDAVDARVAKLEMQIEHDVTQKIQVLFDQYKLTHEKQWELERRMEKLERIVTELQNQTA